MRILIDNIVYEKIHDFYYAALLKPFFDKGNSGQKNMVDGARFADIESDVRISYGLVETRMD